MMYIDENGCDAIYVVLYKWGEGGLIIVGHAKLYYQDCNGKWRCTELAKNWKWKAEVFDLGYAYNTNELFERLEKWNCNYIYLKGDYSKINEFSSKYVGTNYGYNFFTNNCLHYVKDALKYVNSNLDMDPTIVPAWFNIYMEKPKKYKKMLSLNLHYINTLEESSNVLNQALYK